MFGPVRYAVEASKAKVVNSRAMSAEQPKSLIKLLEEVVGEKQEPSDCDLELRQLMNGRYKVEFPFVPGSKLKNNFFHAKRRLDHLLKRLKESPGLVLKYGKQLKQYVVDGHAVQLFGIKQPWRSLANYMPHREVIREESETTKMRIVFDCGAGHPSLND